MSYFFNKIDHFQNPYAIFFLCGVVFNQKEPDMDKRVVLKKFLETRGCCSIILEENFVPGPNNDKLGYKFIDLKNLNDVETLAGMIVDGIFIIHESHSTASELALFASNDSLAKKVFVLVPDEENAEETHFSAFLLFGYRNVIRKPITFYPVTEKHLVNENKTKTHTYFYNNQIGENLGKELEKCINLVNKPVDLKLQRSNFQKNTNKSISYFIKDKTLFIYIDVNVLKFYIISIFNLLEFRTELRKTNKFYDGLEVCEKWFTKILLNTIENYEKIKIQDLEPPKYIISNSINTRLDLRKAISFTLYTFHALGWIKIEPLDNRGISISIKTETTIGFKSIYSKYAEIICEYEKLNIEEIWHE